MVEKMAIELMAHTDLCGAMFRYEVLDRLSRVARHHQVGLLAFGFDRHELRLLLNGTSDGITNAIRGLKVGTARASLRWGLSLRAISNERVCVAKPRRLEAVRWVHQAPVEAGALEPLASPWSSLRDALGYRKASFFDPAVLHSFIDPEQLIERAEQLPQDWYPAQKIDLGFLLRVSAAVLGILPSDRRCFRLFAHLAREQGFSKHAIADALALTERRVRQLLKEPEPNLLLARTTLSDRRLSRVP